MKIFLLILRGFGFTEDRLAEQVDREPKILIS